MKRSSKKTPLYLPNSIYCMVLYREGFSNHSYRSCNKLLSKHLQKKTGKLISSYDVKGVYSESKTETEQKCINGVYIIRTDKDLRRIKKGGSKDYHKPASVCAKLCYEHVLLQAFRSIKKTQPL